MPYNHLDARALNSPGGPIDALTATIRDATEGYYRMRDRGDERTMRRQLLEMQQRQRGEDIRRALAAEGVGSVEELAQVSKARRGVADDAARFNLERSRTRAGTEDALDQDKVAAIGRADFDRKISQALASGIVTPEDAAGEIGSVESMPTRGGILRNMMKRDSVAPLINNAAQRGREDRDLKTRQAEANITATESLANHRDSYGTTKGPMTATQADAAARKSAMDAMGITNMDDLGYDLVEDPITGGMKKSPIPFDERQKRAAAFRPLYIQELNRRGFNEDGSPYEAPPVEVPPNPSDVFGFDINALTDDAGQNFDLSRARQHVDQEGGAEQATDTGSEAGEGAGDHSAPKGVEDMPTLPPADLAAWKAGGLRTPAERSKIRRWLTGIDEKGKKYPPAQAVNLRRHAESIMIEIGKKSAPAR